MISTNGAVHYLCAYFHFCVCVSVFELSQGESYSLRQR